MTYIVMVNEGKAWREYDRSTSLKAAKIAARFAAMFGARVKIVKG